MALLISSYSTVITNGLCADYQALTVGPFSLTSSAGNNTLRPEAPIYTPTALGGGGGGGMSTGFSVPFPTQSKKTHTIQVVVQLSPKSIWRRSYTVTNSGVTIKVMNISNAARDGIAIGVDHIQTVGRRVLAVFNKDNK